MASTTMKVNTYLNYGGNCEEAFRFYERNLGAKILAMMKYGDMPDTKSLPLEQEKFIMHARLEIGETALMASDVPPQQFQPMRSVYLCLSSSSTEEAERIYALLANGGEIFMSMAETFFAFRFGQLRDKFGTNWMIIHERPMPQSV